MPGKVAVDVLIRSEIPEVGRILRRHVGELINGIVGDMRVIGVDGMEGVGLILSIETGPLEWEEEEEGVSQ